MIHYDKYAEENLQHGLGVGSGRGRPKGSRNGYINPNAAYMKNYKVVGEVAEGDQATEEAKRTLNTTKQTTTQQKTGTTSTKTSNPSQRVVVQNWAKNNTAKISGNNGKLNAVDQSKVDAYNAQQKSNIIQDLAKELWQDSTPGKMVESGKRLANYLGMVSDEVNQKEETKTPTVADILKDPKYWGEQAARKVETEVGKGIGALARDASIALDRAIANAEKNSYGTYDANRLLGRSNLAGQATQKTADVKVDSPTSDSKSGNYQTMSTGVSGGSGSSSTTSKSKEEYDMLQEFRKNQAAKKEAENAEKRSSVGNPIKTDLQTKIYPDLGDNRFNRALENTTNETNRGFLGKASENTSEKVLNEQYLHEQVIPEQYLNETRLIETKPIETQPIETKGLRENIEESLVGAGDQVKNWWDGLVNWGENAWNTTKDWAVGAIDTGKQAFKDAQDWIGSKFNDASSWAQTAYKDVSDWMGDRGAELDRWWNGYDAEKTYGKPENRQNRQDSHVNGFRENVNNWLDEQVNGLGTAATNAYNDASKWVQDRANEVGTAATNAYNDASKWVQDRSNELDRWWNGYDEKQVYGNPSKRAERQDSHVNGFRDNAVNWVTDRANEIGNTIGEASDNVVRTVRDAAGNIHQAVVDTTGNIVGWVGERAEDVNDWWNGTDTISGTIYANGDEETNVTHNPGVRENIENAIGNAVTKMRDAAGNVRDAVVDASGNFVRWAENTGNAIGEAAGNTVVRARDAAGNIRDAIVDETGKFVRWAETTGTAAANAVTNTAKAAADTVSGLIQEPIERRARIDSMTGSQAAQQAQSKDLTAADINALANIYADNRPAFDNVMALYNNGIMSYANIRDLIEQERNK